MALASAYNYVDDICVTLQDCLPCDYAAVLPDDMGCCADLVVCRFGCELAELSRRIFLVSIWCRVGRKRRVLKHDIWYSDQWFSRSAKNADDPELARQLWEHSERVTGVRFDVKL